MKWEKLVKSQERIEEMTAGELHPHIAQAHQLRLLLEIHGDLDQIALAQREHTKIAAAILAYWESCDQRAARAEKRAEEAHEMMMEVGRLGIEREKRTAEIDAENKARYSEYNELMKGIVPTIAPRTSDNAESK
jgi:hypothetical protein